MLNNCYFDHFLVVKSILFLDCELKGNEIEIMENPPPHNRTTTIKKKLFNMVIMRI